jgi:hypothetical protein
MRSASAARACSIGSKYREPSSLVRGDLVGDLEVGDTVVALD